MCDSFFLQKIIPQEVLSFNHKPEETDPVFSFEAFKVAVRSDSKQRLFLGLVPESHHAVHSVVNS